MSDEEVLEFRQMCRNCARKMRFDDQHAEDLAQDAVLAVLEGKASPHAVRRSVVDAIRRRYGRPGLKNHAARRAVDSASDIEEFDTINEVRIDAEALLDGCDSEKDVLILVLFSRGFTLGDIGRLFYVSEGRACQLLKAALAGVRARAL